MVDEYFVDVLVCDYVLFCFVVVECFVVIWVLEFCCEECVFWMVCLCEDLEVLCVGIGDDGVVLVE